MTMKQTSPKKKAFKEKIAIFYDSIFHGDDLVRDYPNIWAEFFLLKVNVSYLEELIGQLEPDELVKLKDNINELCKRLVGGVLVRPGRWTSSEKELVQISAYNNIHPI